MLSSRTLLVSVGAWLLLVGCKEPKPAEPPETTTSDSQAAVESGTDADTETATPATCGPGILAAIGSEGLAMTEHDELMALQRNKYADKGGEMPESAVERSRRSIAERLIHQRLVELEAKAVGASYLAADLDARIAAEKAGVEDWAAHLATRGETEATLTAQLRTEFLELEILGVQNRLEPTTEEFDRKYEQLARNTDRPVDRVRARQILVAVDAERPARATKAKAKAEAERLADLARGKATTLAELAPTESDDASTGKNGGDVGFVMELEWAEEFSKPILAAKVGEIIVFETMQGWHVVELVSRWGPGKLPREALEDLVQQQTRQRRTNRERDALEQELLDKYKPQDCEAERIDAEKAAAG